MLYLNRISKYPADVQTLENQFSSYLGCDHALSFCNGTSAFDAAIFGVNIPEDSEVIISAVSFQSTVMTLLHNRLDLKFLDVDAQLDMVLDDKAVSKRTKLLVVSHLFGYPQNMDAILAFAKKHDLRVIEDCSHAHGASYRGTKTGCFGDAAFFSLQGNKAIAGGEAGIAVTHDKEIYDRMRLFMHMGRDLSDVQSDITAQYPFLKKTGLGRKGRMHPFAAALALRDLKTLDQRNVRFRQNLERLRSLLEPYAFIDMPDVHDDAITGGYHYGIPLRSTLPEDIIEAQFFQNKTFRFLRYPYVSYECFSIFTSHKVFTNLLRGGDVAKDEQTPLPGAQKAREGLVFLDTQTLYNLHKHEADFLEFLNRLSHDT